MPTDIGIPWIHYLDLTVCDGADISRCTADIYGNDILGVTRYCFRLPTDDTARWPRHQHRHSTLRTGLYCCYAAIRLNNSQIGIKALAVKLIF